MIEINTNNITLDRGYDEFIFNCRARNLRPAIIQFYDNSIRSIYKFIEPKMRIKDINKATVDNFIIRCQNELNIKDITIHTYLRALKAILYYFMKLGYMEKFHISLINKDFTDHKIAFSKYVLLQKFISFSFSYAQYYKQCLYIYK